MTLPDPSKWVENSDSGWDADEHYVERKNNGFSTADWINFDTYIAWVIASAVEKMKSDGHTMFSYIDSPEDTWLKRTHEEYDVMIKGFGNWATGEVPEESVTQQYADLNAALEIFKKRFKSLWD